MLLLVRAPLAYVISAIGSSFGAGNNEYYCSLHLLRTCFVLLELRIGRVHVVEMSGLKVLQPKLRGDLGLALTCARRYEDAIENLRLAMNSYEAPPHWQNALGWGPKQC
eukprot:878863-Amphidinium_carterae.1